MGKLFHNNHREPMGISIVDAIKQAKQDLDCAYTNFEHAVDPDLIDCYIYELQSTQLRYKFLLNCAKEQEKIKNTYIH